MHAKRVALLELVFKLALTLTISILPAVGLHGQDSHWAFEPPMRVAPPSLDGCGRFPLRTPIDAFIAKRHRESSLTPAAEASRRTLIRRLWLDLLGVPPKPERVRKFLADTSPDAWERVVDEALESPLHGERWGRHWMDIWRYSDWYGYRNELRNSQRNIWRWRDWIIESLNDDDGYDTMLRSMLAADELSPLDHDALRATGFLARNYYKFNRNTWLDDTVEHSAKAFLGITLNCARCHEHKYDDFEQRDYYRFRAFFEPYDVRGDAFPGEASDSLARVYDADVQTATFVFENGDDRRPLENDPVTPGLPEVLTRSLAAPAIEPVDLPVEAFYPELRAFRRRELLAAATNALREAERALETVRADAGKVASAGERPAAEPQSSDATDTSSLAPAIVEAERSVALRRLELESLRDRIQAELARHGLSSESDDGALTESVDRAPELAARAAQSEARLALMRAAIALDTASRALEQSSKSDGKKRKTLEDALRKAEAGHGKARERFAKPGRNYSPLGTVYPRRSSGRRAALARWTTSTRNPLTARVAVNHIWLRHFGEPLVTSVFEFGENGSRPANAELLDWLACELVASDWSMKRLHRLIVTSSTYRMDSQADSVAETNLRIDPENRALWRMPTRRLEAEAVRDSLLAVADELDGRIGGPELDESSGFTSRRRSVYYRHAHEKYMPFLALFDGATVFECYRRDETIVPQQALGLSNGALVREVSRELAAELRARSSRHAEADESASFVSLAFERILARLPVDAELEACREFLDAQRTLLADPGSLTAFDEGAKPRRPASSDPAQRARESLVHALLNHNDFVTIR